MPSSVRTKDLLGQLFAETKKAIQVNFNYEGSRTGKEVRKGRVDKDRNELTLFTVQR